MPWTRSFQAGMQLLVSRTTGPTSLYLQSSKYHSFRPNTSLQRGRTISILLPRQFIGIWMLCKIHSAIKLCNFFSDTSLVPTVLVHILVLVHVDPWIFDLVAFSKACKKFWSLLLVSVQPICVCVRTECTIKLLSLTSFKYCNSLTRQFPEHLSR